MMYDMTETAPKKEKMISTRVTEENTVSMDKVARSQGLTRSQWIRRAILAQLTFDLIELKRDTAEPIQSPPEWPQDPVVTDPAHDAYLEDLAPAHEEDEPPRSEETGNFLPTCDDVCRCDEGPGLCVLPSHATHNPYVPTHDSERVVPVEIPDPTFTATDLGAEHRDHDIACVKSFNHEGACIDE